MRNAAQVLDLLTAAYRLDLSEREYIDHLVGQAVPLLDRGLGVAAYTYDATDPQNSVTRELGFSDRFRGEWLLGFNAAVEAAALAESPGKKPLGFEAWSHLTCAQVSTLPRMEAFLRYFEHFGGAKDVYALNALDASGFGLWLGAPWPRRTGPSAERDRLFDRVSAHITAAGRLRRVAARPSESSNGGGHGASALRGVEAIFAPEGKLLHAERAAQDEDVRAELRRAAIAFDQARTKGARRDVERATRRWRPLVLSRWSMLDEFESDGRRFLVAVDNTSPTLHARGELSEREHQVMTQAELGHSNKLIAYELGLSASTIRVLIHRAARKLGATTRRDAVSRFAEQAHGRPPEVVSDRDRDE